MTWRKHLRMVAIPTAPTTQPQNNGGSNGGVGSASKYSSYLPEVYAGHPNRIQRYQQYDDMDRDSIINAALDTIADFCTQSEEQNDNPFAIRYSEGATDTEVALVKQALTKWTKLNDFRSRMWYIFRSVIKNGDIFFVRDPETKEWLWVDHYNVELVSVDESKGRKPTAYVIKNLDYNRVAKLAAKVANQADYGGTTTGVTKFDRGPVQTTSTNNGFQLAGSSTDPRLQHNQSGSYVVDAEHVVHLSLSVGMDVNWPFGASVLEAVFKTFKQKELLEDAIIIYRVQRAPERRIFKIDVGSMNPVMANAHVERIKNEIHQRRIPNRTGGGSNILDAAYNPLCLSMDTKVPLLDGRTLTITELANEYEYGKENWVYSCNPVTGAVMPGVITWAGVTRKNAQVLKLTLDNGETLTMTPDHKVPVLGKGFVEAQHLTPNDSLISFETRQKSLSKDKERSYQQVYDHETNSWKFTHRMVACFFKDLKKHNEFTFSEDFRGAIKNTVHHKDFNRHNNDPRNLLWMNYEDHALYHTHVRKEFWETISEQEKNRIKNKIRASLEETRSKYTEEDKDRISLACSLGQQERWGSVDKESDEYKKYTALLSANRNKLIADNPEFKDMLLANIDKQMKAPWPNVAFKWSQNMVQRFVEIVTTGNLNKDAAIKAADQDEKFIALMHEANPSILDKKKGINNLVKEFNWSKLNKLYEQFGYQGWKDFKKKTSVYNHRVTKIEWLEEKIDTGCITIDGNERWHSHHTFATEAGVFVRNSMLEDFFFAQSSEGRGSSVETLPGGDQLGEITDLSFFDKKLKAGMRIPASYLPGGDEQTAYSDGKVGTAMIQEFLFNKYCMRLQTLLEPTFDKEFKKYLKQSGIQIEEDLFDLRFNPPQNFSKYRQVEIDSQQMGVYTQIAENKKLSERFKLKRFLNLTEEELLENERLWAEENPEKVKAVTGSANAEGGDEDGLSAVGVRSDSGDDFGSDDMGSGDDSGGADDFNMDDMGGGDETK